MYLQVLCVGICVQVQAHTYNIMFCSCNHFDIGRALTSLRTPKEVQEKVEVEGLRLVC